MKPLRNIFPSRVPFSFENWPMAVNIPPLSAKKGGREITLPVEEEAPAERAHYQPTLILTVGQSGAQFLQRFVEKVLQTEGSWPDTVRALLTTSFQDSFPDINSHLRVHELQQPHTLLWPKSEIHGRRAKANLLFQQAANYKRFQDWLQSALLDLQSNVQCFVVASLGDEDVGMLGEVLQLLQQFPTLLGKQGVITRIVLVLTPVSDTGALLSEEEMFATLREIGRMSFNGVHRMSSSLGISPIVDKPLVDYLLLIDNVLPGRRERKSPSISEILAELLFVLTHPSASFLWENITNDLRSTGNLRSETHQIFVHSAGIASVYVPVREMREYVAARLAFALLFGEHPEKREGIVQKWLPFQPGQTPERLGKNFLLSGGVHHPFFNWFLDIRSPEDLREVPPLPEDFARAVQTQICLSMMETLNQNAADLSQVKAALEWLDDCFGERLKWFNESGARNPYLPERFAFQYVLQKGQETVRALLDDVREWERAFFPVSTSKPASTSWREQTRPRQVTDTAEGMTDVVRFLEQHRKQAEERIQLTLEDPICRSVLAYGEGHKEIDGYYTSVVRPSLSGKDDAESLFPRLQQRLEWWIYLAPGLRPRLYLVCWPQDMPAMAEPPSTIRFLPNQARELSKAIYEMAFSYTASLEKNLTMDWFREHLSAYVDFLRRAEEAYIEYDQNKAAAYQHGALKRAYLCASDPTISRKILSDVFPDTLPLQINELNRAPATRLTALTLRLNLPLDSIDRVRRWQTQYLSKLSEQLHLYPPEQNAVRYERCWWKSERQREMLVPEVCMLLGEQQLVTLFFQAWFRGLLTLTTTEMGQNWILRVKDFPTLELGEDLLTALRRFVLEEPNHPRINENPNSPFNPNRRGNYLATLKKMIKEKEITPEGREYRERIAKEELKRWEEMAQQDALARSFYILFRCELDEPRDPNW